MKIFFEHIFDNSVTFAIIYYDTLHCTSSKVKLEYFTT